jgi:oligoribonuclease NrnB/cAMP/cGMP phosphodiesterase (DHH superfamily)
MRRFVVMYHKFCQDGFCSAAIAHMYFLQMAKIDPNIEMDVVYFPVVAGHVDAAVDKLVEEYKDVKPYIMSFDLSFTRTAAKKLLEYFPTAQVVDHHKTTYDECFGDLVDVGAEEQELFKKQIHFNNDHSGAALAFKFFFNDAELPLLVKYVEDRDLWTWKLPDSKEVSAGIYRHLNMHYAKPENFKEDSPVSFVYPNIKFGVFSDEEKIPVFDTWLTWLITADWLEMAKRDGSLVVDIQNKNIRRLYKNGKGYEIDGKKAFVVNANSYISELGNVICEWTEEDGSPSYNYAMIWRYDATRDVCCVSLRSLSGSDNDVEIIAKNNNGGGHKHAAGFEISLDSLFNVLSSGTWP